MTHFDIVAPANVVSGTQFDLQVTARDQFENVATNYLGIVHIITTDAHGVLPSDYAFIATDAGTHTLHVTLTTPGTQTITATDITTSITGTSENIIVTPSCNESFDTVTAPALPAGWSSIATFNEIPWVTSTTSQQPSPPCHP